jgi:hypothetical protein
MVTATYANDLRGLAWRHSEPCSVFPVLLEAPQDPGLACTQLNLTWLTVSPGFTGYRDSTAPHHRLLAGESLPNPNCKWIVDVSVLRVTPGLAPIPRTTGSHHHKQRSHTPNLAESADTSNWILPQSHGPLSLAEPEHVSLSVSSSALVKVDN